MAEQDIALTAVEHKRLKKAALIAHQQLVEVKALADAQVDGGFGGGRPEIVAALISAMSTNYLAQVTKARRGNSGGGQQNNG